MVPSIFPGWAPCPAFDVHKLAWRGDARAEVLEMDEVLARSGIFQGVDADAAESLAKNLLQMAGKFGTRDGGVLRVTHDLTQEELAQLVGASRETVNKALADFASRGWLRLDGKSVIILDPERLARRARV